MKTRYFAACIALVAVALVATLLAWPHLPERVPVHWNAHGAVDGEICRGTRTGRCADLVRELAAVTGELRSTELIYCWDPDGPSDPRGFARADHCDHIHWGMDG